MKMPGPYWMGAKTVNTMHSIFKPYKGSFPVSLKTRIYSYLFVNRMIEHSDRLIAVSNFVSDCLKDVYGVELARIDTIYHGIGHEFERRSKTEVSKYLATKKLPADYVLCVGNVFPVKNHLTAVRAFAQADIPEDSHLVIAGDTSKAYASEVVAEIAKLGLQERVHLLGFVSGNELALLLSGAWCMLFPSLTEGFGVTLLEAFQCGLPVIASKRGSLWEIGKNVAVFVEDPMDVEGFANELTALCKDASLRDRLSNAAVSEAQNYSWDMSAKAHIQTYEKTLDSLPGKPAGK
jgi:glycosyltransferase involved in cell wall biosynthesis